MNISSMNFKCYTSFTRIRREFKKKRIQKGDAIKAGEK